MKPVGPPSPATLPGDAALETGVTPTPKSENGNMETTINLEQLRRIKDGSGHSIFGPSSSAMYLNCPGSLIPNLLAGDDAGYDAAWGTVAHEVTEECLKHDLSPFKFLGKQYFIESGDWGFLIYVDEEMVDAVQANIDWVEFLPGKRFIERRVDFSRITPIPNQSGTSDLTILHPKGRRLINADWKYGKGYRVYAKDNSQGMLYALGSLWEFDPEGRIQEIEIRIGQPRLDHFDEWVISRDDLLEFAGWAKARMHLAWQIDAPRIAGEKQCRWCRVSATCAAKAKMEVEMTEGVFDNLDHPVNGDEMSAFKARLEDESFDVKMVDVGNLTTEHLARLRYFRAAAEKWWGRIDSELFRRAADGEDLARYGSKIVEGRSRRKFKNEAEAAEHLEFLGVPMKKIIKQSVVSPAESEKLLRGVGFRPKEIPSLLGRYVTKPPGKPTIVPLTDKRQPIADLSEAVFDDLDSETSEEDI